MKECIKEIRKSKGDMEMQNFLYDCGYSQDGLVQLSTTSANIGELLRTGERELQEHLQFN